MTRSAFGARMCPLESVPDGAMFERDAVEPNQLEFFPEVVAVAGGAPNAVPGPALLSRWLRIARRALRAGQLFLRSVEVLLWIFPL